MGHTQMPTRRRRSTILNQVLRTGYVEARQLAEDFGVDVSTIRRDLAVLAGSGELHRTHGGARVNEAVRVGTAARLGLGVGTEGAEGAVGNGIVDVSYTETQQSRLLAKRAIAASGCAEVQDGDSVLLDSGSTTFQLAVALADRQDLTVITNDLSIAYLVSEYPGIHLLIAGSELLKSTHTLVGRHAADFVADLRADWAFLGVAGIDVEAGITITNTIEVPFKRSVIDAGSKVIVLADSAKFDQRALVRVANLDEIDYLVTDTGLTAAQRRRYGDRVVLAASLHPPAAAKDGV